MREVAIVGAGDLGGATAHVLARQDSVRAIRLVDETGSIAAGKALDIAQAAPVEGFSTRMSGTTDVASAAGAQVIVIADRADAAEWRGDEGALLVKRLAQLAPKAVLLCAGASQRDLVDRAVRELHLDRQRILGSAPEALVATGRAFCALAVNGSPRDVALSIVGNPPGHTVILWESAVIGGIALTSIVDEPTRRRLQARIAASWPPGPYALACAAAAAIDVMCGRSRRTLTCFVGPDTAAGTRARTAALPLKLGASGVFEVLEPALSAAEQTALDNAMML
jgi:malate dehydrogenase